MIPVVIPSILDQKFQPHDQRVVETPLRRELTSSATSATSGSPAQLPTLPARLFPDVSRCLPATAGLADSASNMTNQGQPACRVADKCWHPSNLSSQKGSFLLLDSLCVLSYWN